MFALAALKASSFEVRERNLVAGPFAAHCSGQARQILGLDQDRLLADNGNQVWLGENG